MTEAIFIILGALLGAGLSAFIQKGFNRASIHERQITQVYSPLLGIRDEVRQKDKLDREISKSALAEVGGVPREAQEQALTEYEKIFFKDIDYWNNRLQNEIIPAYERMISILRDNFWLLNESTRQYLPTLITVVEVWKRDLKKSISSSTREALPHNDEALDEFYKDLEQNLEILRKKVQRGWSLWA